MEISTGLAKWAYAWNWAFDRTPYPHYKDYARIVERKAYPQEISLCPLFWRTFVVTPALCLGGLLLSALVLTGIRDAIVPIAIAAGVVGVALGFAWLVSKIVPDGLIEDMRDGLYSAAGYVSPVFKGFGKVKKTMCPIFWVKN